MNNQCVQKKKKRVTFRKAHENRKIEALLKDLYLQIVGKDHKTSQKIDLALSSLSKYPVQITSGKECFILKGFDKNLCSYVDEKLFNWDKNMALVDNIPRSSAELFSNYKRIELSKTSKKNNPNTNTYGDKMDTSQDLNVKDSIDELESESEAYANSQRRAQNDRECCCQPQVISPLSSLDLVHKENPLFIDMPPGSYEIVMFVDKNEPEILSAQGKYQKCESRNLKVGDVIWVARNKTNSQELVLPYILERKRMDDFASSIKDGRFHEQKFRLRKCGLRNVIYLLEDYKGNKFCGLSMATLNQAKANTRIQDGFLVHHTDSLKGTKRFLNMMTVRLACELEGVHLRGTNTESGGKELMTFEYFNASSSKTKPLTVKEMFIKMLLQLKGLSVEKALAITKVYNSPKALMDAYKDCDTQEGETLLANLRYNSLTPRVGPAISKIIYMLFNNTTM